MASEAEFDAWSAGQSYEHYMGRWSRKIAAGFLAWLDPHADADWLEIGCGTGALTEAILQKASPRSIKATDQSSDFVDHARQAISDPRASFAVVDALELPADNASIDVITAALVLNFIPDRTAGLKEMRRTLRPGGLLSFYVWDYPGGGMGFTDTFWKAAASLDGDAAKLDEALRFPFCTPEGLLAMCREAGIADASIEVIEVSTEFPDFEAFWHPFTLGAEPAPGYCMSLSDDRRNQLKELLGSALGSEGPVRLPARAWAVTARLA